MLFGTSLLTADLQPATPWIWAYAPAGTIAIGERIARRYGKGLVESTVTQARRISRRTVEITSVSDTGKTYCHQYRARTWIEIYHPEDEL